MTMSTSNDPARTEPEDPALKAGRRLIAWIFFFALWFIVGLMIASGIKGAMTGSVELDGQEVLMVGGLAALFSWVVAKIA